MARVFCPNCGTEFEPVNDTTRANMMNVSNMNVNGVLIPKEIHNDNIKREEKENDSMNMNNFNMEELARMVATQIKKEVESVPTNREFASTTGGKWAKNSKFYGKEICGFAYNPYLVRRFLPRQFMDMMKEFNLNVNEGIRCEYGYMKGLKYLIEECDKLAMLHKRDKIAFDERSRFWSVSDCKKVFTKYANSCLEDIERLKSQCTVKTKKIRIPNRGDVNVKVTEVIKNHNIVLKVELESNVEKELELLKENIDKCWTYKDLANTMKGFKLINIDGTRIVTYKYDYTNNKYTKNYMMNRFGHELPTEFVRGFKKSGAYYTLKNMIMFEECEFKNMKGRTAVIYLRNLLEQGTEDYVLYAMLKEVIVNNRKLVL